MDSFEVSCFSIVEIRVIMKRCWRAPTGRGALSSSPSGVRVGVVPHTSRPQDLLHVLVREGRRVLAATADAGSAAPME
jgi:hypothetical protein